MSVALSRSPTERRTQAERSEAMRSRLIEATLECMVSDGYMGLTIAKITERAGVSRGAPLHHFASKGALVEAAAQEVMSRIARKVALAYYQSKEKPDPLEAFVIAVWYDVFSGPEGQILNELTYASRREPEIQQVVQQLSTRIYRLTGRVAARYFDPSHPSIPTERALFLTQWLMRGMVQDLHLGAPPQLFEAYLRLWRRVMGGESLSELKP